MSGKERHLSDWDKWCNSEVAGIYLLHVLAQKKNKLRDMDNHNGDTFDADIVSHIMSSLQKCQRKSWQWRKWLIEANDSSN